MFDEMFKKNISRLNHSWMVLYGLNCEWRFSI